MFAFADNFYNGPVATVAHAIMSATLTQVGTPNGWWLGLWLHACLGLSCTCVGRCPPLCWQCVGLTCRWWFYASALSCPALPCRIAHPTCPHSNPPVVQAWFPAHAEIWNAPTWFLSALTFAMIVLPHVVRGWKGGCGLPMSGGRLGCMQCLA